jgi:A/G-specific adenine glycosylase
MRTLHIWYEKHGRHDLPWRKSKDPYRVYLSEVMLQQTQVERVVGYFDRFLQRWPTLADLAAAKEDEVVAAWSGLGYYSRARNLHRAAKICGGTLPREYKELLRLPGVGEYTAAAICAFAYDEPRLPLDTNITRVLARYLATTDKKRLKKEGPALLDPDRPRDSALALMDLGALVCRPAAPLCEACPLAISCKGKSDPHSFYAPKKMEYEPLELHLGVWIEDGKVALAPSTQLLYAGMLTLPSITPPATPPAATIRHSYTRYRVTAHLYLIDHLSHPHIRWVDPHSHHLPISTLTKKAFFAILDKKGGDDGNA